jgi:hypothetical protein
MVQFWFSTAQVCKEHYYSLETELCDKGRAWSETFVSVDLGSPVLILDPWFLLRKEVIQPQVPLRLPCYDFIPITIHTFGACLPCGLAQRLRVQTAFMM